MSTRLITTTLLLVFAASAAAVGQQLTRKPIPTATYRQGERSVVYERGIPRATVHLFAKYLLGLYGGDNFFTNYDLYRMPNSTDQFFATAYEDATFHLLLLRLHGDQITEVSQVKRDGCGLEQPYFFSGPDRVLLIVSNSAADGGYCGNWAFEFTGNGLKALGDVDVYDGFAGKGAFQGDSPLDRSTTRFTDGKYYLTMRGRGPLYSLDEHDILLAARGVPLTCFYDGTEWRRASR